jgi:phosphopantothenoylcysteine decarboxylase/phosphopantothenate--cysteine ligase
MNPLPGKLANYEVLLCVTGGIAAYKAADLASRFVQAGAGVSVAMTENATRFVGPMTFQAITRRQVFTSMWSSAEDFRAQHIALTERADLMLVAPATANCIAKFTYGLADDLVSALALSAFGACELLVAPAMNTRMWKAHATQENIAKLKTRQVNVVGPDAGYLACGTSGEGRLADIDDIYAAAEQLLLKNTPKSKL